MGSDLRTEQEMSIMLIATPPTGLPTVHATASDMFETSDPLDVSQLKGETCENPPADRGAEPKGIGKTKERATKALDSKFDLSYYYVSGKYREDEDNGTSNSNINSAHDTIISISHLAQVFELRILLFDLTNACFVPTLKDENAVIFWTIMGPSPSKRSSFGVTTIPLVQAS